MINGESVFEGGSEASVTEIGNEVRMCLLVCDCVTNSYEVKFLFCFFFLIIFYFTSFIAVQICICPSVQESVYSSIHPFRPSVHLSMDLSVRCMIMLSLCLTSIHSISYQRSA